MRVQTILFTFVFATLAGIVAVLAWLQDQNETIASELVKTRRLIEERSAPTATESPATTQPYGQMQTRMGKLETSVNEMSALLAKLRDNASSAAEEPITEASSRISRARPEPPSFSDSYVTSDQSARPKSRTPYAQRVYNQLSSKIALEGESPKATQAVAHGLEQLTSSTDDLASRLAYDPPICSAHRCVTKVDVSSTQFSMAELEDDPEYEAEDAYYDFALKVQRQMERSLSPGAQVSIARNGDELVLNIFQKRSAANSR